MVIVLNLRFEECVAWIITFIAFLGSCSIEQKIGILIRIILGTYNHSFSWNMKTIKRIGWFKPRVPLLIRLTLITRIQYDIQVLDIESKLKRNYMMQIFWFLRGYFHSLPDEGDLACAFCAEEESTCNLFN